MKKNKATPGNLREMRRAILRTMAIARKTKNLITPLDAFCAKMRRYCVDFIDGLHQKEEERVRNLLYQEKTLIKGIRKEITKEEYDKLVVPSEQHQVEIDFFKITQSRHFEGILPLYSTKKSFKWEIAAVHDEDRMSYLKHRLMGIFRGFEVSDCCEFEMFYDMKYYVAFSVPNTLLRFYIQAREGMKEHKAYSIISRTELDEYDSRKRPIDEVLGHFKESIRVSVDKVDRKRSEK